MRDFVYIYRAAAAESEPPKHVILIGALDGTNLVKHVREAQMVSLMSGLTLADGKTGPVNIRNHTYTITKADNARWCQEGMNVQLFEGTKDVYVSDAFQGLLAELRKETSRVLCTVSASTTPPLDMKDLTGDRTGIFSRYLLRAWGEGVKNNAWPVFKSRAKENQENKLYSETESLQLEARNYAVSFCDFQPGGGEKSGGGKQSNYWWKIPPHIQKRVLGEVEPTPPSNVALGLKWHKRSGVSPGDDNVTIIADESIFSVLDERAKKHDIIEIKSTDIQSIQTILRDLDLNKLQRVVVQGADAFFQPVAVNVFEDKHIDSHIRAVQNGTFVFVRAPFTITNANEDELLQLTKFGKPYDVVALLPYISKDEYNTLIDNGVLQSKLSSGEIIKATIKSSLDDAESEEIGQHLDGLPHVPHVTVYTDPGPDVDDIKALVILARLHRNKRINLSVIVNGKVPLPPEGSSESQDDINDRILTNRRRRACSVLVMFGGCTAHDALERVTLGIACPDDKYKGEQTYEDIDELMLNTAQQTYVSGEDIVIPQVASSTTPEPQVASSTTPEFDFRERVFVDSMFPYADIPCEGKWYQADTNDAIRWVSFDEFKEAHEIFKRQTMTTPSEVLYHYATTRLIRQRLNFWNPIKVQELIDSKYTDS